MAERHKAMLAGNTQIVEQLTADDYLQTDISGYVQDRSAWLNEYFRPLAALMRAGKFRWNTYEERDVQVRMFGNTAVVMGSMNLTGTGAKPSGHTWVESPGTSFAGTLRFTRVWVNRDGTWRVGGAAKCLDAGRALISSGAGGHLRLARRAPKILDNVVELYAAKIEQSGITLQKQYDTAATTHRRQRAAGA
jgi:hypothetical protein